MAARAALLALCHRMWNRRPTSTHVTEKEAETQEEKSLCARSHGWTMTRPELQPAKKLEEEEIAENQNPDVFAPALHHVHGLLHLSHTKKAGTAITPMT